MHYGLGEMGSLRWKDIKVECEALKSKNTNGRDIDIDKHLVTQKYFLAKIFFIKKETSFID